MDQRTIAGRIDDAYVIAQYGVTSRSHAGPESGRSGPRRTAEQDSASMKIDCRRMQNQQISLLAQRGESVSREVTAHVYGRGIVQRIHDDFRSAANQVATGARNGQQEFVVRRLTENPPDRSSWQRRRNLASSYLRSRACAPHCRLYRQKQFGFDFDACHAIRAARHIDEPAAASTRRAVSIELRWSMTGKLVHSVRPGNTP